VTLTLVDSIVPKGYLCKLTMIVHGPLGCLLLSVIFLVKKEDQSLGW
jgi:hypothetical protein